ncbi:MAG: hypothetical protein PWP21_1522 [Thermosediminibacterales bacterium]|nr:hypothetical protein [Thermosediminibacterales bacterium]
MKNSFLFALILFLSVSLFGCVDRGNEAQPKQDGQPLEKQQQADENKEDTKLPAFKGTVLKISDKNPQIEVLEDTWLKAKEEFIKRKNLSSEAQALSLSDFRFLEGWGGTLNNKEFQLDIYSCQASFLFIVSKYGDNTRVNLSLNNILTPHVFYDENVFLAVHSKGVGQSFNIITNEFESSPDEALIDIHREWIHEWLNKKELQTGSEIKIAGHDAKLVDEDVLVITNK